MVVTEILDEIFKLTRLVDVVPQRPVVEDGAEVGGENPEGKAPRRSSVSIACPQQKVVEAVAEPLACFDAVFCDKRDSALVQLPSAIDVGCDLSNLSQVEQAIDPISRCHGALTLRD